jgi:hypothetical protein
MSSTTITVNPPLRSLTDAVRNADATLGGDGDLSLTSALKQLVTAVRAHLPVVEYTVKRDDQPVAVVQGLLTARAVARLLSRDTGGLFTVVPPEGSQVAPETWVQGIREEEYGNGNGARS